MLPYEYKTQIRYNEINENNELSDKGILAILSEAAGLHSQEVGYGLNSIEETNCTWMILYWKVQIFKRPKWRTEILVKTWPRKSNKASIWRDYELYTSRGEKIAIASTQWVAIDARKGSIMKITDEMLNSYGILERGAFKEEPNPKIKEPDDMQKVYEYTAERRDIDTNHHVNNITYLDYAYNALPANISVNFNNIEIHYKKQIKLGDTIACYYAKEGNTHTVSIRSLDGNTLHAVLKFS